MQFCRQFLLALLSFSFATQMCFASIFWTNWLENPSAPLYNPYEVIPSTIKEDYYPYIIFNREKFNGDGSDYYYKMWHQSDAGIAVSYSNDGLNWVSKEQTNITGTYSHPVVLYSPQGFMGADPKYHYRIWFWNTSQVPNEMTILYALSTDGVNWETQDSSPPQYITQNLVSPLVNASDYFYALLGPGFVIYNSDPSYDFSDPYTFPYVMFYDVASNNLSFFESIALAYSEDGIQWTRFGDMPLMLPLTNPEEDPNVFPWEGTNIHRPSILKVNDKFHMFYSGGNQFAESGVGTSYAQGIGHAISSDGIHWVRDIAHNPIFHCQDGIEWRNSRSYTPFVLFDNFGTSEIDEGKFEVKMWFTGGSGLIPGQNQNIGFAILHQQKPRAPRVLRGLQIENTIEDTVEHISILRWKPSKSREIKEYRVYRNGAFVSTVGRKGPFVFVDHSRDQEVEDTYEVRAVNIFGTESDSKSIIL